MKKNYRYTICLLLALMLGGCASMHTDSNPFTKSNTSYMKSHSVPNLQIPAGLSSLKVGDDFRIPPSSGNGPIPASTVSPYAREPIPVIPVHVMTVTPRKHRRFFF